MNKNHKAIIGITLDRAINDDKNKYAAKAWYALRTCYSDAVIKHGAIPLMLPYNNDIESINIMLDNINGLLLSGGDSDIDPKYYNQPILSDKTNINKYRCDFEFKIIQEALKRDMPIFGICNGMQMINVALGGDLIQHIPDLGLDGDINHEQPAPKDIPSHDIIIKHDSLLYKLANQIEKQRVNSTHHQAVGNVGSDILVSAVSPDGIIEAIESKKHKFVVGIQWHGEYLNTQMDENLFKAFINAAR